MKKTSIKYLEEVLDERWQIALDTDKRMGNESIEFLKNNPDYIYYQAMLDTIVALGMDYKRQQNGKHIIFE